MSCGNLLSGFNASCVLTGRHYYQNVVLINKADVDQYQQFTDDKNSMYFNLKAGKSGFLFASNNNQRIITASFDKLEVKNVVYYDHKLSFPIVGTSEEVKVLLRELDDGEYFGALHHVNGDVEIFGFDYGLKTSGYGYEPQSGLGGVTLNFRSDYSENYPPFNYLPNTINPLITAIIDFDNLFANISPFLAGDFNDDFNNDFYITQ